MGFLFLLFLPFFGQSDLQPEFDTGYEPKEAVFGKNMMVVSANSLASKAGYEILEKGGNALDAAIAIQMVLNLVEPQSSGIGGGGFLLYYIKDKNQVIAYDGRETAPQDIEMTNGINIVGGKSVGTPGLLKMLELAYRENGTLPWKDLFQPAIDLAHDGFPISSRLNKLVQRTPHLATFPESQKYFFDKGKPKTVGAVLKNPELAETLRLIAEGGIYPFYEGEIAKDIVKTVQESPIRPGKLSLEDLAHYQAVRREPLFSEYKHYRLCGFPPPSAGGIAVAQIFGMLNEMDFKNQNLGSPEFINVFCRASRAAYTDRQLYVGDPAYTNIPVNHLLNPQYLRQVLKNPNKTVISALERPSTSQICVVDKEGNAVSFTTSIEYAFGSSLMVRGFFLNNQMTDFSAGPNRIEPGKRPMSSMSPTFVFKNDRLFLNVGSAGGARIIDYVAKTLFGVLEFDLNIQDAISFPNFTSISENIDLEKGTFLEGEVEALEKRGNQVRVIPLNSGTQGIQINQEDLIGGSDPRREGLAIGN